MGLIRKSCVFLCGLAVAGSGTPLPAAPVNRPLSAAARALEHVPAWFEPNQGLLPPHVKYFSKGAGYALLLEESGAVVSLADGSSSASVRLTLLGSRTKPEMDAADLQVGRSNYILGNQPSRWTSNVPHYARVRYRDVYAGIDLVYRGAGRQLEYDFVVSPGADPSRIRMRFQGAGSLSLDQNGSLVLGLGDRQILQPKPVVYQDTPAGRMTVDGSYLVARNREVRFTVGKYDKTKPLVIDPVLVYAGYFGGDGFDSVTGVAHDRDGSVWLTGTTMSVVELPAQNEPRQSQIAGTQDAFLAKLSVPANGTPTLLYWTYLGGADREWGGRIWVDPAGMVYATGSTVSFDFPKTANAVSDKLGGAKNTSAVYNQDAFVVKINPASPSGADSLVYGSYLGGGLLEVPTALAVDPSGKIYVAGYTSSVDIDPLVSTTLQPANRGGYEAFFYKIEPGAAAGASLLFNTYFGGRSTDVATGVGFDASGAVYISGYTFSDDLPIAGDCHQCVLNGGADAFLAKLDLTKTGLDTLVYASYLGGSGLDLAQSMAMDASGGIWLTGYTLSPDFPVTPDAYQPVYGGGAADAFLARVDLSRPPAEIITYGTYFGGSGTDIAYGLALLGNGKAAITGYTLSNNLPVIGAPASGETRALMADAFVAVLDTSVPGVGGLAFSTYFGGTNQDVGLNIAPDPAGNFYVVGYSYSRSLPVTDGNQKRSPFGSSSGFLLRLDKLPGESASSDPPPAN